MSAARRSGSPDPGGRPLLGVVSIALLIAGFTRLDHYAGLILVVLGILVAILFAFHSRVRGVRAGSKFEVPIAPHEPGEEREPRPVGLRERRNELSTASLGEISNAARHPETERQRGR